ncbi:MAG: HAMP domain-containing protein [Proteobacteria bacterium]|nr:HAMP domain-containing protein [Pseudomonadota bacterium]
MRRQHWEWGIALLASAGFALVLVVTLALLAQAPERYERYFVWLFWLNLAVAALLAAVVLAAAVRLAVRLRQGKFGSRLLLKLAGIFVLVGVVPGALLYTVSVQFLSHTVNAWFDTSVAGALDAGLNLGKASLDALAKDLADKSRSAAALYAEGQGDMPPLVQLERLRDQLGAQEMAVVAAGGQILLTAGTRAALSPERPDPALMRQARLTRAAVRVEGLDDETLAANAPLDARVRVLVAIPAMQLNLLERHEQYLMVVGQLPSELVRNALTVQAANRDYQQRMLARDGLRRIYIGTLTLTLVLAVFAALLMAAVLGNQIGRPLLVLAQGVRRVAGGDLRRPEVYESNDDLGRLTRSFADMTEQLNSARAEADRSFAELASARGRLQTILDNLTAGVIVFDPPGRIDTVNPGATRILRAPLSAHLGAELAALPGLAALGQWVGEHFARFETNPGAAERDHWQDAFELARHSRDPGQGEQTLTLLVRGAVLPGGERLMVFDDITEVVVAQRSAAWSEVARRLAHEIKNPLTPIQLSAERLQHKLEAKLADPNDAAMLARSVATIVAQVQAMKELVNAFRDYARLPAMQTQAVDLNALVTEVLGLYGDAQDSGHLHFEAATDLPPVQGDPSQLRQVVHNLVQNALDATEGDAESHVHICTDGVPGAVRLTVRDNGPGFAPAVMQRAFEPYVTTKSKGTGLGLAVVKKIADEHGARIRLYNHPQGGAEVSLSFSMPADSRGPQSTPHGDHPSS